MKMRGWGSAIFGLVVSLTWWSRAHTWQPPILLRVRNYRLLLWTNSVFSFLLTIWLGPGTHYFPIDVPQYRDLPHSIEFGWYPIQRWRSLLRKQCQTFHNYLGIPASSSLKILPEAADWANLLKEKFPSFLRSHVINFDFVRCFWKSEETKHYMDCTVWQK